MPLSASWADSGRTADRWFSSAHHPRSSSSRTPFISAHSIKSVGFFKFLLKKRDAFRFFKLKPIHQQVIAESIDFFRTKKDEIGLAVT
jgi:hypothetical protein